MRFAFLGCDVHTPALAAAVLAAGHELVGAADCDAAEFARLSQLAPGLRRIENWESLLDAEFADGVIVARHRSNDDARADELRKLVQEGVPVLVAHPVHDSMLVYFELEMIREVSNSPLVPYSPTFWHPALDQLDVLTADDAELGSVQQVAVERLLADRSRRVTLNALVGDLTIMQAITGDLRRVAAMGSQDLRHSEGSLSIQFNGPRNILTLWSVGPLDTTSGARVTMTCSRGKAVLWIPDDVNESWTFQTKTGSVASTDVFRPVNRAADVIDEFAAAIEGEVYDPTWLNAAREMELVDAVELSLRKGKTVDVYQATASEHGTFKGIMAAGGCGLLLLALVVLTVATIGTGLGLQIPRFWPLLLLLVLGGFLALQLLRFVFPSKNE